MIPPENEIEPIERSCGDVEGHTSLIERYYSARYCTDVVREGDDYCVLVHSNRVCLVTLAESHYMLANIASGKDLRVESIAFKMSGDGVDRLSNAVSGKRKRGAQRLVPGSPLAEVRLSDGSLVTLSSPVEAKLLEVNTRLLTRPQLISTNPGDLGYIAIVLPELNKTDHYKRSLLNESQYRERVSQKKEAAPS